VPFRGSGQTTAALIAGQIDLTIDGLAPQLGNIRTGRVRALGVSTHDRASEMPDIPAMNETLPGFEYPMWVAVFAPGSTPKPIVDKMSAAIVATLKEPSVTKRYRDLMVDIVGSTPAELDKFVGEQLRVNKAIIEKAGIQVGD
jgi:tripartite-type tricarboxylate transporter receptor subunit TctC